MMYGNSMPLDNTMPLDNIVSEQSMRSLPNMNNTARTNQANNMGQSNNNLNRRAAPGNSSWFGGMPMMSGSSMPLNNTMPLDNVISEENMRFSPNVSNTARTNHANNMGQPNNNLNRTTVPDNNGWSNGMPTPNNSLMSPAGTATRMDGMNMTGSAVQPTNFAENMMMAQAAIPANAPVSTQTNTTQAQRRQAAMQLAQSSFAVHEAVLYLDTHINDPNALEYYRKKQQQAEAARAVYESVVGPITSDSVDTTSGSWTWIETPWPWQIVED